MVNHLQSLKLWQNNCEIIYDPITILKFGTKLKLAICNFNFIVNSSILLPLDKKFKRYFSASHREVTLTFATL